ncbi:MAG: hypothetical protein GX944_02520 [Alphaproteobacteria bacterium]|nr:hypothetical protein [Alphaproteobacteria bacterium]
MSEIIKNYHNNGILKEIYEVDNQGRKNGLYNSFTKNGQLWIKSNYKDDKLHDKYLKYYENGKLAEKSNYLNGKLHGNYLIYHDGGYQLREESNYKDGNKHGKCLTYYVTGQLKEEGKYVNVEEVKIKNTRKEEAFNKQKDLKRCKRVQELLRERANQKTL